MDMENSNYTRNLKNKKTAMKYCYFINKAIKF